MLLIIILAISLGIFLFSMDLSWSNVVSDRRNDLVFEGRNHEYGAYKIRHEHHLNMMYALLISIGGIGGGLFLVGQLNTVSAAVNPKPLSDVILTNITFSDEITETEKPEEKQDTRRSESSGGSEDTEVVVVEDVKKSDDKKVLPGVGTGEDPIGIVEPYDPGDGGGTGGSDKSSSNTVVEEKKKIHEFVKYKPEFPGGDEAFLLYMLARVKYNTRAIHEHVEGTIYFNFVIDENGHVSDIKLLRNIRGGDDMAAQAIKALEEMPTWKPGSNGEEPLRVKMTLPLKVELRD